MTAGWTASDGQIFTFTGRRPVRASLTTLARPVQELGGKLKRFRQECAPTLVRIQKLAQDRVRSLLVRGVITGREQAHDNRQQHRKHPEQRRFAKPGSLRQIAHDLIKPVGAKEILQLRNGHAALSQVGDALLDGGTALGLLLFAKGILHMAAEHVEDRMQLAFGTLQAGKKACDPRPALQVALVTRVVRIGHGGQNRLKEAHGWMWIYMVFAG